MRSILATAIAVSVLCGTAASAAAPFGTGKVYSGEEGVSVAVIPLTAKGPKGTPQVLIHVQGTGTEFDGKAMLHSVNDTHNGANYITQYKGEDFYTLTVRSTRGDAKKYELWVPERRNTLVVAYDDKRTQSLDAAAIYEKHEKQKKDGTLGGMAAFNRKEREASGDQGLAETAKELNETCGTKVTASIDWKSVSDDVLKKYSISSYCGNPLVALRRLCDTPGAKRIIQNKVKTLTCQFGAELKLDVQAGAVSWTTAPDSPNQEAFAKKYFEKNL
ncbi:MAG: hypothetical protein JXB05_16350 [Myxococcaceae bacterium]|nr:hypothetical protein [Myxococcaceae bacterium]